MAHCTDCGPTFHLRNDDFCSLFRPYAVGIVPVECDQSVRAGFVGGTGNQSVAGGSHWDVQHGILRTLV